MRSTLRHCLRSATRSFHATLDARLALPTRVSREGYARYLLTNWPFSSIERGVEEAGVELFLPDWKHRRRRFDLSHDLRDWMSTRRLLLPFKSPLTALRS